MLFREHDALIVREQRGRVACACKCGIGRTFCIHADALVNANERHVRVFLGGDGCVCSNQEPDGDDHVEALVDEGLDVLSVVRDVLCHDDIEVGPKTLRRSLRAFVRRLVEGFVLELSNIGDNTNLKLCGGSGGSLGRGFRGGLGWGLGHGFCRSFRHDLRRRFGGGWCLRLTTAAGCEDQRCDDQRNHCEVKLFHGISSPR